jgi:hypothetical protein
MLGGATELFADPYVVGSMRSGRAHLCALVTFAVVALAAPAAAAPPVVPDVVLGGHLYPKPYGLAYAYGEVRVPAGSTQPVSGQTVTLYQSIYPFTAWAPVATLTTDFGGYFSFHETIAQNVAFRAVWNGVVSKDKLVKLPLRVSMKARRSGRSVIFRGSSFPLLVGRLIELQRLGRHGGFHTFARVEIGSAAGYERRVATRRGGVFRALAPADGQYAVGASRPVRVKPKRK